MASERDILRAEAVHLLLRLVDEKHEQLGGDCIIFMTADLIENFFKNIPKSGRLKATSFSLGMPIDDVKLEAGMSGYINNIEFHVIEGKNKIYGGTFLNIDTVVKQIQELDDELS